MRRMIDYAYPILKRSQCLKKKETSAQQHPEMRKPVAHQPRNRLSIIVAFVSFVISIVSFYNSSLRQVDDVSIILKNNGRVSDERWTEAQQSSVVKPQIHSGQDLIFINAGTRPLALLELTVAVTILNDGLPHDDENDRTTCKGAVDKKGALVPTNFEPFVIKPSEIIPRRLQFREDGTLKDSVRLPEAPSRTQSLRVCFRFGFATPDSGYQEVVLKRPPFTFEGPRNFFDVTNLKNVAQTPQRIVYRNRTTVEWLNRLLEGVS